MTRPLLADTRLRKLSFTGSTAVGKELIKLGSTNVLRMSMELGGNAPFIVFEDGDLDAAVEGAVIAKMRNMGEACTAANRFYAHASIAGEFARRLAERLAADEGGRGARRTAWRSGRWWRSASGARWSTWSTMPWAEARVS